MAHDTEHNRGCGKHYKERLTFFSVCVLAGATVIKDIMWFYDVSAVVLVRADQQLFVIAIVSCCTISFNYNYN